MSESRIHSIKLQDYEIGDIIKIMPLGKVKIAKSKRTNEYIVIKILIKSEIVKSKQEQHILNELDILEEISHPSIISCVGFTQDEKYLYLAFEFVPGGDLFNLLKIENNFLIDKAQFYAGQIVFAFEYLHSKNIVYRNLKPENILINKNGYIKIADFQFAKVVTDRTYTMCGTPGYLAPEIILNRGHGLSVDWWTLGVLLYEMICGVDPFADDDPMKVYENILERNIQFSSHFDDKSKSLIKHLLEPDLSRRYGNLKNGVNDIKNHLFFKSLNWDKLLRQEIEAPFIPKLKGDNELKYYNVYPEYDDGAESLRFDPFSKISK
jgi:serine/threonine protein kinase